MSPKISDSQREKRKQQVLDAAKRVFSEKGYGAATLKDIIEETGMSRGWIYLYFQTKEEIFEALLDHQDAEHEQYIDELLQTSANVWDVITTLYSQQQDELLKPPRGGMLPAFYEYFLIGWRDAERSELLLQRYEEGIVRFAALLQKGVDQGEFSPAMSVSDISKLAASFQEGILTHTITVGPETANTQMQQEALIQYLHRLLHS